MEVEFRARQEAQEERWQAKRDEMQKLDQALTYMQSLGSAMGLSPPQFPPTPLPPRADTPTTVSVLIIFKFHSS